MSSATAHFSFYLPEQGDGEDNGRPWATAVNDNFTSIDTILQAHAEGIASLGTALGGIVGVPSFTSADIGKTLQVMAGPVLGWVTPSGGGGRLLKQDDWGACMGLLKYSYSNGKFSRGLWERRYAEYNLCISQLPVTYKARR